MRKAHRSMTIGNFLLLFSFPLLRSATARLQHKIARMGMRRLSRVLFAFGKNLNLLRNTHTRPHSTVTSNGFHPIDGEKNKLRLIRIFSENLANNLQRKKNRNTQELRR